MNLIFSCNFCIFPKFLILNIFYNLKNLSENIRQLTKEVNTWRFCAEGAIVMVCIPSDFWIVKPSPAGMGWPLITACNTFWKVAKRAFVLLSVTWHDGVRRICDSHKIWPSCDTVLWSFEYLWDSDSSSKRPQWDSWGSPYKWGWGSPIGQTHGSKLRNHPKD